MFYNYTVTPPQEGACGEGRTATECVHEGERDRSVPALMETEAEVRIPGTWTHTHIYRVLCLYAHTQKHTHVGEVYLVRTQRPCPYPDPNHGSHL